MTSIGDCILHEHDLRVLALAVALTVFTLLTSSVLLRRASRKSRGRPQIWLALGALCAACGIWSVHFVAMLAYLPGASVGYRMGPTLASLLLIAVGALGCLFAGERANGPAGRLLAGAVFGMAVTAMHYLGMSGFEAPGRISWDVGAVAWSAIFASLFGAAGFALGVAGGGGRPVAKWRLPAGGLLVALGVLLLHFTGMSAIRFRFDPRVVVEAGVISRPLLALMISAVACLAFAIGAVTAYQEHRHRRRALKRLKLLSASSFEGVALLSGDRITEVNAAFAEAVGLERKAIIGRLFRGELFTPDAGQDFSLDGRTEGRLAGTEGREVPVEVLARSAGADDGWIVAVRDLTERRQKEESLSLLFHRNPAPVWVSDLKGRVLAANPAALALYGYSEADFLRLHMRQLLPPEEFAAVRTLAGPTTRYVPDRVWRHLRSDGSELLVLPYTEALTFAGHPAILVTVFDVTERERSAQALQVAKEAAEAANRAKSTFLANMSHEIRTPLNGVLGMSQAMAAGELSPIQRQRVQVVLQSGQTLLHLLNDLLDVSRIEAGRVEVEEVEFDLAPLLMEVQQPFRAQAEVKGLAFAVELAAGAGGWRRGDPLRLKQVLANLLSNAVKFTGEGSVVLRVAADGPEQVHFEVCDTGEGIEAATLERLFQTFVQADASTTRRHGGSGLGLSISRDLARLMGGEVEAASRPGEGSTFRLVLPLAPVAADVVQEPEVGGAEGGEDGLPGVRILAAEDNATNRLVLETLLAQDGIQLVLVENGAQAVDAWRDGGFDVLLMDVQMPVMDGPTAVRAIRDEEARLHRARTPIVAVTANVMSHQLAEYREAGMDAHVAKPIDLAALFATLEEVLSEPALAA